MPVEKTPPRYLEPDSLVSMDIEHLIDLLQEKTNFMIKVRLVRHADKNDIELLRKELISIQVEIKKRIGEL